MAKNETATESSLSALHAQIARVMKRELDVYESAQNWFLKFGDTPYTTEDGETVEFPQPPQMPPALLSAITKFLKDNDVTAVPEDSDELSELEQALAVKRKRRPIAATSHEEAVH